MRKQAIVGCDMARKKPSVWRGVEATIRETRHAEEAMIGYQCAWEGTSIADHLNEMQGIFDQLSRMGINFDDEVFALMVLASLPESWETLEISITNTAPNGAVNMKIILEGGANLGNKGLEERAEGSQINMRMLNAITAKRRVTSKSSAGSSRVNKERTKVKK
ncbi:hypothetical protein JRO89_XS03G0040500 [Xanthoceras sorbifolium]|uniref:Retrovirus-related Pol polyprotein from transposon TNT 1-94 n=1 Tax=Xanthoceras sorbifolium TaxID=99658 RepID=A0ABQ8I8I6_9ROSI|nr:hypothetical protein JRO89_XS03G0040500 [Xanthoceras sorbifolium]